MPKRRAIWISKSYISQVSILMDHLAKENELRFQRDLSIPVSFLATLLHTTAS
jgi:hypothetical protein